MKRFETTATVIGIRLDREDTPVMTVRFPLAVGMVDQLDFFNPFGFELGDKLQVVVGMDMTPPPPFLQHVPINLPSGVGKSCATCGKSLGETDTSFCTGLSSEPSNNSHTELLDNN